MILAFSGRLPDPTELPPDNVDFVFEQVKRLIVSLAPRMVVGSAAAGADLIVLRAALESGVSARVIVAGTVEEFRASSVAGRGEDWERLFDLVGGDDRVEIHNVRRQDDDDATYDAVNTVIAEHAKLLVQGDEAVVGLNVSVARAGPDHSEGLAAALQLRGGLVLRIDPTRLHDQSPAAFVAMPFGRRPDPLRGWANYDADATYRRIILPALIDAGYRAVRADTEALLEVIDLTMLRLINTASVLIADLATLNPNVMWEVGVRHAWRRAGTILLRPVDLVPPFDVSHARVHPYSRDETRVSDADAVAGIALLRGLLAEVSEHRTDSPVFLALPGLAEAELESLGGDQSLPQPSGRYIEAIGLAADMADGDALKRLATEIAADADLDATGRNALLTQAGLALVGAGAHAAAVPVLAPLAESDRAMEHMRLQQEYAHALIRSEQGDGRSERLGVAEERLKALLDRWPASGETYGLLGSAAKARVETALAAGRQPGVHLDLAIEAYLQGFRLDPGDYYPGVVAVALLRVRGQRIAPDESDVRLARELLPVVRFAVSRLGEPGERDVWRVATLAELALHEQLMGGCDPGANVAARLYARVAAIGGASHSASVVRQLVLLRDAGDPTEVIAPLLALFDRGVG